MNNTPEIYRTETSREADDSALLDLELKFDELISELVAAQRANEMLCACYSAEVAEVSKVEAILQRLCPIERAIMQTPANTPEGLGVKARHAAHVLSHFWNVSADRMNWDDRAVRLLIEAVCNFSGTPLNIRNLKSDC
jgi:hypothetical protein